MAGFYKEYAHIYDILYAKKEYERECDIIEGIIKEYKPGSKRILDYGCGTGGHAQFLSQRGYHMSCLDIDENILQLAKQKLALHKNVQFYNTKERDAIQPGSIDVCITLFDVLSFMHSNEEINEFFSYVKRVLQKDGLFIFDFWYGPAVINLKPEKMWKEFTAGDKNVLKLTSPVHDLENSRVDLTHDIIVYNKDRILQKFRDHHRMRYFFQNEIESFLAYHNFKRIKFGTMKDINTHPTIDDWSVLMMCTS